MLFVLYYLSMYNIEEGLITEEGALWLALLPYNTGVLGLNFGQDTFCMSCLCGFLKRTLVSFYTASSLICSIE